MIGQWKQIDESLRSIGGIGPNLLTLHPPRITESYYEETLRLAGKSVTAVNLESLVRQTSLMFLLKCQGYIATRDQRAAQRFIDDHGWTGDPSLPQVILNDLANWNYGVVPYLQDLPWRVRGLLLEKDPQGELGADIWQQMH